MRTFMWSRFASRSKPFRPQRGTHLSRSVRLHAELLEDRLMMSGNDPDDDGVAVISAADDKRLPDEVVETINPQSAVSALTLAATDAPWGRFESAAELEAWLIEAAVAEYGDLFGQTTYYPGYTNWYWGAPILRVGEMVAFGDALVVPGSLIRAASFDSLSNTNVQVDGVDEADLVETDGEYLYIVSGQDLVIVEAGEGDNLRVVSRVHLDERPVGMYLAGDRLAIVSSSVSDWRSNSGFVSLVRFTDIAYFDSGPPKTTVTVLDIADRAAPTLVQKSEMDGQLVTSRVVDGQLRLVLNNRFNLPEPIARPVNGETDAQPIEKLKVLPPSDMTGDMIMFDQWYPNEYDREYVYETKEEYLARVRDTLLESIRPDLRSLDLNGGVLSEAPLFDATDVYRPDSLWHRNVTTNATFDLNSDDAGPAATASVMTEGDVQVYATAESIYLFAAKLPNWRTPGFVNTGDNMTPRTDVWKFAIDGDTHGIELVAKGEFEGTLLNQFAADEHDGYLRVVAKSESWTGVGQSVLVLQQNGDDLNVVGSVGGIATDESLYSVRFVGERAYFVTFRQVDPLFAVDLSDPTNPELLGELHIPGYSDYLQPIDENHVLAIGRGADESSGQFQELQVSIFDVSDPADPQLVHRYSFGGGRTTATPATGDRWTRGDGDHHAVGYFPEERIFTLPIFTADDWSWLGTTDNNPLFEVGKGGLQVFTIDVDAGFTPLGVIEHDTLIERSVQIGDRLFAISSGTVTMHNLTDPTVKLGEVDIAADSSGDSTELTLYQRPIVTFVVPPIESPVDPPIEKEIETAAATSSIATTGARDRTVDPRVGWALPNLAHSRHAQPARFVALTNDSLPPRFDDGMIQLLAAETATQESSRDEIFADERLNDDWDEVDRDAAGELATLQQHHANHHDSITRSFSHVR